MTEQFKNVPHLRSEDDPALEPGDTPGRMDRRSFFRGAAALAAGSMAAPAALAQSAAAPASQPTDAGAAARLEAQTRQTLRWAGADRADWVRPRKGVDQNVVIVGGGQNGVGLAYGLKRKGVGGVQVIDQSAPGQAGVWRTIARMRQLRSPKTLPGPDQGNPALSFRGWFEALNGPTAFDALDRVPTHTWADYLDWFQKVTDITVRSGTRLLEIEPQGDVLRLHLSSGGAQSTLTTRKLVIANGYAGAGGLNLPDYVQGLPSTAWTHSQVPFDYKTLAGKFVAVIGAGSSAFDSAAVALESGAKEVHLFSRDPYISYQAPSGQRGGGVAAGAGATAAAAVSDRGYASAANELLHELPDAVRWKNFIAGERRVSSVPFDSLQRAVAFNNFHIHLDSVLTDVKLDGKGGVTARADGKAWRIDHLIAGTGYRTDLSVQPEFARIQNFIALWRDRYRPQSGEESEAGGRYPYLGKGFEFLPRQAGAEFLRNIHCYNFAAALSFGKSVGDIAAMVDHPLLVSAVARDLFAESVDPAAHERYINTPQTPQDPAPYQHAFQGKERPAA